MANPALAEARVSCPVCRAPVHPIAGRCKHCKADLVRARGGNTGAGESPLAIPSGGGVPPMGAMPLPAARAGGERPLTGHPMAPPMPARPGSSIPVALPAGGSMSGGAPLPMASHTRAGGWRQRWPLLVAVIAAIAILASLAVLVFGDKRPTKARRALGPAPDRMDTGQGAPPSMPLAPSSPPPSPPSPAQPSDPDPIRPKDPFATPSPDDPPSPPPSTPGGVPKVRTVDEFLGAAIDVGCERLLSCSGLGTSGQDLCDQARGLRDQVGPLLTAQCTSFDAGAAQACLGAIARFPCPSNSGGLDPSALQSLLLGLPGCSAICDS